MQKNSIQFFGLPGSGKTSLLNSLVQNYPEKYQLIPKFSRSERFKLALEFSLRFPKVFFVFSYLIFRNDIRLWSYISHLVSQSFAGHMYAIKHRSEKKLFLIDEGILQRLLSVAPAEFSVRETKRLIEMQNIFLSLPIIVKGGDFGRFVSEPDRMNSYRNRLGPDYFNRWSQNMLKNFKNISLQIHGAPVAEKGSSADDLHRSINS